MSDSQSLMLPMQAPMSSTLPNPHIDPLTTTHDQAKAKFDQSNQAMQQLSAVRGELDKLAKLGDTVTSEDVIQGAGSLVAAGLDPHSLAALLADMPTGGGNALAGWITQHDAVVTQREQQVAQVHATNRHQMGVAAIHGLIAHSMPGPQMQSGASPPQPNALMGGPNAS